jgi:hypothetical protein
MLSVRANFCYVFAMLNPLDNTTMEPDLLQQKDQQIAALENQVALLAEQLAWLKRQLFGAKSERLWERSNPSYSILASNLPNLRCRRSSKRSVTSGANPSKNAAAIA